MFAGLQVAVDDAGVVGLLQRLRHLAEDAQRALGGERTVVLDEQSRSERPSTQAHGEEAQPVALADVVDADDVLVRDLAGQHQLPAETRDPLGIRRPGRGGGP